MRLTILQLKGVGPQNAKALEKAGYYYAEELALIPVENVSKQTGIPESELQRFKTFVHLMRIKSIGPNYANLLYRDDVRIFNLNDLAKAQPEDLYQKLKKSNRNKRLVKVLPTFNKVEKWIKYAQEGIIAEYYSFYEPNTAF